MRKEFNNFKIAVDSETGIYWYGERCLRTQAQIDALIKQAANEKVCIRNYAARGQNLLYFAALKIIRTTASYFGIRLLRNM